MKKKTLLLLALAGCSQAFISAEDDGVAYGSQSIEGSSIAPVSPRMKKISALADQIDELYYKRHESVEAFFGENIRGYKADTVQIDKLGREIDVLQGAEGIGRNRPYHNGENRYLNHDFKQIDTPQNQTIDENFKQIDMPQNQTVNETAVDANNPGDGIPF